MKSILYFGKLLSYVALPCVFTLLSSIILSVIFACVGVLIGHNAFVNCFQSVMGVTVCFMSFVAFIAALYHWLAD